MRTGHFAARNLCNVYNAIQAGARRWGLDPRVLNPARQPRDVLRACRAGLHRAHVLLFRQLPAQFGLALRLGLGVRCALGIVSLFGEFRALGFLGAFRLLRALGVFCTFGLLRALGIFRTFGVVRTLRLRELSFVCVRLARSFGRGLFSVDRGGGLGLLRGALLLFGRTDARRFLFGTVGQL